MSTVFKGLTRPALIRGLGVPLYPFLGMCVICVLLGKVRISGEILLG
uniref:Uncharacterized protein n=1 Tax=Enterobacter cloacae TaxID=550 RepID=A0A6H1QCF0_ENTCL|nr:hypothetical protein OPAJDNLE_04794 [Enterobacter cloacae]